MRRPPFILACLVFLLTSFLLPTPSMGAVMTWEDSSPARLLRRKHASRVSDFSSELASGILLLEVRSCTGAKGSEAENSCWARHSLPYGEPANGEFSEAKLTYTGLIEEGDQEQGSMYAAHFRHLRPGLGRWAKRDSAGFIDGPNLYRAVNNSPTNFVDRTGNFAETPWDLAVLGADLTLATYYQIGYLATGDSSFKQKGDLWVFAAAVDAFAVASPGIPGGGGALTVGGGTGARVAARAFPRGGLGGAIAAGGEIRQLPPAGGGCLLNQSKSTAKAPVHHIATNKNKVSLVRGGPWTPRFEAIFQKAGVTLNNALNKVPISGHFGPHPEAYHKAVFQRLQSAVRGLKQKNIKAAFERELRAIGKEVQTPGTQLNRLLTEKK